MRTCRLVAALLLMISACGREELEPFSELDRNSNGRVSRSEAAAEPALAESFTQLDINEDGELSASEYLRAATRR